MKYGTIFNEKLFSPNQWQVHFEKLLSIGIQHLELTPHEKLIASEHLIKLTTVAQSSGMTLSFHTPDFIDPILYDIGGFEKTKSQQAHWDRYFSFIAQLHHQDKPSPLVFHGASHQLSSTQFADVRTTTYRFMDWASEHLHQYFPELKLLLENTCPLDQINFGQTAQEMNQFISDFQGAPVGLCLDLAHYLRTENARSKDHLVDLDFTDIPVTTIGLIHSHAYSPDGTKSHLPFSADDPQIKLIKSSPLRALTLPVVFEILSYKNPSDEPQALQMLCQVINLLKD